MKTIATGYGYDYATRDWTNPVAYEARDRMEAIRWMNFNRSWLKGLRIIDADEPEPVDTDGDPRKGHRC